MLPAVLLAVLTSPLVVSTPGSTRAVMKFLTVLSALFCVKFVTTSPTGELVPDDVLCLAAVVSTELPATTPATTVLTALTTPLPAAFIVAPTVPSSITFLISLSVEAAQLDALDIELLGFGVAAAAGFAVTAGFTVAAGFGVTLGVGAGVGLGVAFGVGAGVDAGLGVALRSVLFHS
jgi:hypothetical protein